MAFVVTVGLLAGTLAGRAALAAETGADAGLVLDKTCYWRQYYVTGLMRISADSLKAEGEKLLKANGLKNLERETKQLLKYRNVDWSKTDWQDVAVTGMLSNIALQILPQVFPPNDWAKPEFDDSLWVRQRIIPLTHERGPTMGPENLNQAIYLRTMFDVPDPAKADKLALSLTYRGGCRVFVNGQELDRGHLPKGEPTPQTKADDYPEDAYRGFIEELDEPNKGRRCVADLRFKFEEAPKAPDGMGDKYARLRNTGAGWLDEKGWNRVTNLRDRRLGPVAIPSGALRKGTNVLAVEIRASHLHPIVLYGAGGEQFSLANWTGSAVLAWAHAQLVDLELRDPGGSVPCVMNRPRGLQAWVEDMHTRLYSPDFNQTGGPAGTVCMVGGRNGTYSAQLAVGSAEELTDLKVTVADLKGQKGDSIAASAVQVQWLLGEPLKELYKLGYDRGPGGSPVNRESIATVRYCSRNPAVLKPNTGLIAPEMEKIRFFDHISADPVKSVPADSCQPIWLTVKIPETVAAGVYKGGVKIEANGVGPVTVPLELEVFAWRVPSGLEMQTDVMFEQSPYALAKHYKVPLWSDEHFKLIEASFRLLARLGNDELFIPVLSRTEFGNIEQPGMIKWTIRKDGSLAFDYTVLDRYLELAAKHLGKVRVISFVIMHWQMASAPPSVLMYDESAGKNVIVPMGWREAPINRMPMWKAFCSSVYDHMAAKGLQDSVYWGHGGDHESDPPLILMLNELFPNVYWTAAPHSWTGASNGGGHNPRLFRAVSEIYGATYSELSSKGWLHRGDDKFLNPRCARELGGISKPYPFRDLADQAIRGGHTGLGRMGLDYYDLTWNEGYLGADWNPPGMPFFMFSWPGKDGAESSARLEAILEGVQEAEIRIFIEQAIARSALPGELAKEATKVLDDRFVSSLSGELACYGWQQRSRALYQVAAKVAAAVGLDVNRTAYSLDLPAMGKTKFLLRLRNWTGQPARAWKAVPSEKWIVPAKTEGTTAGHEDLVVTLDGAGLSAGKTLSGTLTVTDAGTGGACTVKIDARTTTPADLLFDHPNFNVEPGKGETRDFRIVNYAADEQSWSLASSVPWLKIEPTEGKLAGEASMFVKLTATPPEKEATTLDATLTFTAAGGAVTKTVASKCFLIPPYVEPKELPTGRVLRLEKLEPGLLKSHKMTANGDKTLLYYWDVNSKATKPNFFTNATAIIGKKKFDRYMVVLPHHETVYKLEGTDIDAFSASVGVAVEMAKERIRHHERRVNFEIYVDGKLRCQSGLMTTTDEPRLLVVEGLAGAKEVKLVTRLDSNKDNPNFPVIWAQGEFYGKK